MRNKQATKPTRRAHLSLRLLMLMHAKDRAPAACSTERVQQQQQPAVPLQSDVTRHYDNLVTWILVPSSHFRPRKSGRTNFKRALFGGSRAFGIHTTLARHRSLEKRVRRPLLSRHRCPSISSAVCIPPSGNLSEPMSKRNSLKGTKARAHMCRACQQLVGH